MTDATATLLMRITAERWEKIAIEPRAPILLAMIERAKSGQTFITWPNACAAPDSANQLTEAEIAWLRLRGFAVTTMDKSINFGGGLGTVTRTHGISWEP